MTTMTTEQEIQELVKSVMSMCLCGASHEVERDAGLVAALGRVEESPDLLGPDAPGEITVVHEDGLLYKIRIMVEQWEPPSP